MAGRGGGTEAAESEHRESDEERARVEAEGEACEEAELGVHGLDSGVGEAAQEDVVDRRAVLSLGASGLDEGGRPVPHRAAESPSRARPELFS